MAQNGVLRRIFSNFMKSLQKAPPVRAVGEDSFGTKYFEQAPNDQGEGRLRRWFQPLNESRFDQEIPVEWEAWLRFRRTEPPTPEEIETNRLRQEQTLAKAREIEAKHGISKPAKNPGAFPELPGYEKVAGGGYLRIPSKPDPEPKPK